MCRYRNGTVYDHPTTLDVDPTKPNATITLRQYFIDWRNPDAAAFFTAAVVNATLSHGVDATFTDDREGVRQPLFWSQRSECDWNPGNAPV